MRFPCLGILLRVILATQVFGLIAGHFTFCGWLGGWEGWKIETFDYFGVFGDKHPAPFWYWHGLDATECIPWAGFIEWELSFIWIAGICLSLPRVLRRFHPLDGILLLGFLGYLALKIGLLRGFENAASEVPLYFHLISVFVLSISAMVYAVLSCTKEGGVGTLRHEGWDWDLLLVVPFCCGLGALIQGWIYYPWYYFESRYGTPLAAIPAVVLSTLAFSGPMLLQIVRAKGAGISLGRVCTCVFEIFTFPLVLYAVSATAYLGFFWMNPGFHQNGNAGYVNLMYFLQKGFVNMAVVFSTYTIARIVREQPVGGRSPTCPLSRITGQAF